MTPGVLGGGGLREVRRGSTYYGGWKPITVGGKPNTAGGFSIRTHSKNILPFRSPPHITHLLQPLDVVCFQPLKHYHAQAVDNVVQTGDAEFTHVKILWLIFSRFGGKLLKSQRYFYLFAKQVSFHLILKLFLIDFRLRPQTLHLIWHNLLLPHLIVQLRKCNPLHQLPSAILHTKHPC